MGDKTRTTYPASPGLSGAIKDAVKASVEAVTPYSLRPGRVKTAIDTQVDEVDTDRLRKNQHSPGN